MLTAFIEALVATITIFIPTRIPNLYAGVCCWKSYKLLPVLWANKAVLS